MNHTLSIEGFEGQLIEVQPAGMFTGNKLLVNGNPAVKGKKRGQMLLWRNDGREVTAAWKSQFLDVPQLLVDGKTIQVVKPLRWFEWLWSALPVLLIFAGGAIGGLAGFIGFSFNARIFRGEQSTPVKYLLTLGISAISALAYFILSILFLSAIRG